MSVVSQLEVVIGGTVDSLQSGLLNADREVNSFAGRVSQTMAGVGKSLTVGVTLPLIGAGVAAGKMAIDWESQFAGVRKTVNGTEEELAALEQGLRSLATASDSPVAGLQNAQAELAGIAEIAGQLGVETDNILGFTETIAQLGMATNLSGEEAALALAQFANITGMDMGNIDRLGATIVDLGNNMATTEADIVAFAQRLAGAGTQAGMSETEILALSGAMASVGLNPEAAGTAMTQVVSAMTEAAAGTDRAKLDLFAAIAGMPIEDFQELWQEDAVYAISDFVAGLNEMDPAAQIAALDDLGLSGIRVTDTLRRLGGNTELLTDALARADSAWESNTALTNEAQQRFATTSAQINLLFNNLRDVGITVGAIFLPAINDAISVVVPLLQDIADLNPDILKMGVAFLMAAAAAGPLVTLVAALISPVGLAAGAFAAAAVGVPLFVNALRDASPEVDTFVGSVEDLMTDIGGVSGIAEALALAITGDLQGFSVLPGEVYLSIITFRTNLINKVNELLAAPTAFAEKITGIGESLMSGIADSINLDLSGVAIDLTGVEAWATANTTAILSTIVSVVGIVLGGPLGMTIGAAKLVASAIESDFLGIGTFLDESGIQTEVETALTGIKSAIEGIISSVFGSGDTNTAIDSAMILTPSDGGDTSGISSTWENIKNTYDTYIKPVVDALIDVASQNIGPGLADLSAGIQKVLNSVSVGKGLETGMASLSTLTGIIIRIGGMVTGGLLSGIGEGLPLVVAGIGGIASAAAKIGEGDYEGALSSFGTGLKSLGEGLLAVPATVADEVIGTIEKLTGIEAPSVNEGLGAWAGAWENAGLIISTVLQGLEQSMRMTFAQIKINVLQWIADIQTQIQSSLGIELGSIAGTRQAIIQADVELSSIQIGQEVTDEINAQISAGMENADFSGVLLDLAALEATGGEDWLSEVGPMALNNIQQSISNAIATGDMTGMETLIPVAQMLDFDLTDLTETINTKLSEAAMMGDEETFNALLPMAADLDIPIDSLVTQMDDSIQDAATDREYEATADLSLLLNVNVDTSNMDDEVKRALAGFGLGSVRVQSTDAPSVHHTGGTFYNPNGEGLAWLQSGETVRTVAQERALQRSRGGVSASSDTYVLNSYGQSEYALVTQIKRAQRDMAGARV